MNAVETIYRNYRFRSRLEARWAIFFDTLGVPWEYEQEGFKLPDGTVYLPDFWLPQQKCFIEIKGEEPTKQQETKARLLALSQNKLVYLFSGSVWIPGEDDTYERDRYGHGEVIETVEKGAYCYDPSDVSLSVNDTASPCYQTRIIRNGEGAYVCSVCGQEKWKCASHLEIYFPGTKDDQYLGKLHLIAHKSHLIQAVYIAEALSPYGDSCKLRLDTRGKLQYLVPRYDRNHPQGKQYHYTGRTPGPMPQCIAEHKQDFEKLLSKKPHTWEWGMGTIGVLYNEPGYRWRECPFCKKFWITSSEKLENFPCYEQHEAHDELFPIFYDSSRPEWDRTFSLIEAYTAARQARFEHGERG